MKIQLNSDGLRVMVIEEADRPLNPNIILHGGGRHGIVVSSTGDPENVDDCFRVQFPGESESLLEYDEVLAVTRRFNNPNAGE